MNSSHIKEVVLAIDRDRPSSWVPFEKGKCATCVASCCFLPLEVQLDDLLRLGLVNETETSGKKIAKRLGRSGLVRSYRAATGLFMLQQKSDGSCTFLQNSRCSVYENRPRVCRGFPIEVGPRLGFCPHLVKDSNQPLVV